MSIDAPSFRSDYLRCRWIFDFFAIGYDFLNPRFSPPVGGTLHEFWHHESELVAKSKIAEEIIRADGLVPEVVRQYLNPPRCDAELEDQTFCVRLFCLLKAIDEAVAELNYLGPLERYTLTRWAQVQEHFQRNGKQLQKDVPGYVVFKSSFAERPSWSWVKNALRTGKWKEIEERGEHLQSDFENLLRAPQISGCKFDLRVIDRNQDFEESLDWTTLRIGIVPLIERVQNEENCARLLPGPLILKKETEHPPTFTIRVADPPEPGNTLEDLCTRAELGLRYLAEQRTQMVLFPEMVIPDAIVNRIQSVVRELTHEGKPCPGLVLAGTFTRLMPGYSETKPFNTAVVLNHLGLELWQQRKLHPYDMKEFEQKSFGIRDVLGGESCREFIEHQPRKVCFVDSRVAGFRMVVLICEDATQDQPCLDAVRAFLPNLILAPVMAGPLRRESNFATQVRLVAGLGLGLFVVANSAGLARTAWEGPGDPELGIIGLPLLNLAENHRAYSFLSQVVRVPNPPGVEVLIFQCPA